MRKKNTRGKSLKLPKTAYRNLTKRQQQKADRELKRHLMDCQKQWANSPLFGNTRKCGIMQNARNTINMRVNQPNNTLSDESFAALEELARVLQTIHQRMVREGYTIIGGRVVKSEKYGVKTQNKCRRFQRDKERQVP